MDDQELAAIRAARLQQLQQQGGVPNGGGGDAEGEDPEAAAAQRRSEEEMKRAILAQILEPAARERRMSHPIWLLTMLLTEISYTISRTKSPRT